MASPLTQPYYTIRRGLAWTADRVMAAASDRAARAAAIESPRARGALLATLEYTTAAAHLARLAPRVDLVILSRPDWSVAFIGDPFLRTWLEQALFGSTPAVQVVRRVGLWDLGRAVELALEEHPLVVCSLPPLFPSRWRPAAPLTFRTPVFIDHAIDIQTPVAEQLRGSARQEVRHLLARARTLEISARASQDEGAFRRFYFDIFVPFQSARHGVHALIAPYETLLARLRRPDCELLEMVHAGRVVAGNIVTFAGAEAGSAEMGMGSEVARDVAGALPTAMFLAGMERARLRGCSTFRMGGSRAACSDPIFRAKRRWGARTIPRGRIDHPDWTWFARELPTPLANHLNAMDLVTFCNGRSCVVRLPVGNCPAEPSGRLDCIDGWLLVKPGCTEFVPAPSGSGS